MINRFRRMSTFKRMSLITFIAIMIVFLFAYISQFVLFRVWATSYEKENIEKDYNSVYQILNSGISESEYNVIFKSMDLNVLIYDNSTIEYSTNKNIDEEYKLRPIDSKKIGYDYEFNDDEKIYINSKININGDEKYIYIIKESDVYADFLENTEPSLIITLVLAILLSIGFGIYVSKTFINKLKKLRETIILIKEEGISKRVKITNPKDEFDKVNILFNGMMDEVEESINNQKRFVQDASHELKTPLTILKGHIKMLSRWGKNDKEVLENSLEVSLEEIDRLSKLVNDLLVLGRIENSLKDIDNIHKINVNEVLEEVSRDFNLTYKYVVFKFDFQGDAEIKILKEHLKQLGIIFIDNAIKYCDKDEKIIKIKSYKNKDEVGIIIEDNGIGIPREDINKITERFYRVDKAREYNNSFGIGLSVAAEIIKLYNAKLNIESNEGIGTKIKITFINQFDNK